MKKTITLSVLALAILATPLSAQITQEQADAIVREHLSNETRTFTILALESENDTIITCAWDRIELDYPRWTYFVWYAPIENETIHGRWLMINRENGNLLEMRTINAALPVTNPDLGFFWRVVPKDPNCLYSVWRFQSANGDRIIDLIFYPTEGKVQVKTTPDDLGEMYFFFRSGGIYSYRITDGRLYFQFNACVGGEVNFEHIWEISFPSENEMVLDYGAIIWGNLIGRFSFVSQTDFKYPMEVESFCLFSNLENFYKTAPFINAQLEYLSKNDWSDEQKLQALVEWLKSHPCVIDAKLEFVGTERDWLVPMPPGRYGRIVILLDDNGITRELTLNIFGEHYKLLRATDYSYLRPKEVGTHLHRFSSGITTTRRDVFDFINLFDHKVLNINKLGSHGYTSSMPRDSLDYIVNNLRAKPYLSRVHGWWNEQLFFDVTMTGMENKAYQADWFKTMNDYKLTEITTIHSWFIVNFEVPDGKETEWIEKFNTHELVFAATRNRGYRRMIDN